MSVEERKRKKGRGRGGFDLTHLGLLEKTELRGEYRWNARTVTGRVKSSLREFSSSSG